MRSARRTATTRGRALRRLRLYIAGDAPNSQLALANLQAIIKGSAADRYAVEVIDVLVDPGRALADSVIVTPTLIRMSPGPERRIVGNLSEREKVLHAIGGDA